MKETTPRWKDKGITGTLFRSNVYDDWLAGKGVIQDERR